MDLKEVGCGLNVSGEDRVQWQALVNTGLTSGFHTVRWVS